MRTKDPIEEDIKLIEQKQQLEEKISELEDRSRKNNLRFSGFTVKIEGTETWEERENFIWEFIEGNRTRSKINVKKIGIIVQFLNYKDKDAFLNQYRQKQYLRK